MSQLPEEGQDYRLHPGIRSDISAIIDHYLLQDSPSAAERVVNAIFDTVYSLIPSEVRHRGHHRYDLTDRPLRFISVYGYLIAYAPDEDPLHIIAVLYGSRDPQVLASLLNERH